MIKDQIRVTKCGKLEVDVQRAFASHFSDMSIYPVNIICDNRYGPFWLSATLVFLTFTFGNYATYLHRQNTQSQPGSSTDWYFDIDKVSTAFFLFYGYITIVPSTLHLYLLFSWKKSVGLMKLVCVYGYALAAFVPISV